MKTARVWALPVLVAVALATLFVTLLAVLAEPLATALLPLWASVLPWISPELAAPELALTDGQVRVVAGLGREVLVGHQLLSPDPRSRVTATVPLGPALVLPLLLLLAGTWTLWGRWGLQRAGTPDRGPARRAWVVFVMAIAGAAATAGVETPLLLAAAIHDELLRLLSPASSSPLVAFAQWLNHGGRWVLAAAGMAALIWPWLGAPRPTTTTASPHAPTPGYGPGPRPQAEATRRS